MTAFQEFKSSLKSIAVEEYLDLVFYRPLAFLFVKLIYSTSITPNQLTLLSMFLGVCGGACFAIGSPGWFVAGGIFYLLYNILDCSDGQLARLKQSGTPVGRILDGLSDYVVTVAAYVGIGIGYAATSNHPMFLYSLTVVAGISNAIHAGLLDFYRNRYLDITLGRRSILTDEQRAFEGELIALRGNKGHLADKALIWIYLHYSRIQRQFTAGKEQVRTAPAVDPAVYQSANRVLMRWWTFLGPTTQCSLLIVCALVNRLDIYLVGIVTLGNLLAVMLTILQRRTDSKITTGRHR